MKKEIVVIGGGFAGIALAKRLAKHKNFHVTLVDKNNYNFFPPLLYQVATGFLEVGNISYPFRKLFQRWPNVDFRMGELWQVLPEEKKIILSSGPLHYDELVLATGTESNYFGNQNVQKNAIPMKTIEDALVLRNTLLMAVEKATITTDEAERRKLLTIVIAGGGPTGVEVAGMLAEMGKNILEKEYPELQKSEVRLYLVDGAPTLLSPMSESSQQYSLDTLTKMGVRVQLNKLVKDYVDDTVIFADGETIQTKLLFWTAGVTSKVFEGIPQESYGRGRRLLVDSFNQVLHVDHIYAIGDTALMTEDVGWLQGHPQLAQPAIQQGRNLANNLEAKYKGKPLKPFTYQDRGSMAIIGRSKAVADLPRPTLHIKGFIAWIMWLFVHLFSLIHYRNRITTMYNWTVAYFTKDQALRMIIRTEQARKENTDS